MAPPVLAVRCFLKDSLFSRECYSRSSILYYVWHKYSKFMSCRPMSCIPDNLYVFQLYLYVYMSNFVAVLTVRVCFGLSDAAVHLGNFIVFAVNKRLF